MVDNKEETLVVEDKSVELEVIAPEEVEQIKTLKTNAVQLVSTAEKAYVQARVAELEAQNYILQIFLKYKVSLSEGENINDLGHILRKKA